MTSIYLRGALSAIRGILSLIETIGRQLLFLPDNAISSLEAVLGAIRDNPPQALPLHR